MKDVIYMAAKSYDEIHPSTIVKSWRKLWPKIEEIVVKDGGPTLIDTESEDNAALLNNLNLLTTNGEEIDEQDVLEWVTIEHELENEVFNDDEIIQTVVNQQNKEDDGESAEEDKDEEDEEKMSHAEGKAALQLAATYIEQQKEATTVDVMFIKKWRDFAHNKSIEGKVQKKITDFF